MIIFVYNQHIRVSIIMISLVDSTQQIAGSSDKQNKSEDNAHPNPGNDKAPGKLLSQIVNKHRKQRYIQTFLFKLRRNNIYQEPIIFELKTETCNESFSLFRLEGIDFKYKSVEGFIFAGDIVFSIVIFYIAVLQTFIRGFRTEMSNTYYVIALKVMAIGFQFSKVLLKSIKKDMVNGKLLVYLREILKESIGLVELVLYLSAICLIVLTITHPLNMTINSLAFIIAAIKLFKIPVNLRVLDLFYINSQTKQSYWNLTKVIIFQLLFMHFTAGLLLGMVNFNDQQNWIIAHDLTGEDWGVQYFYAIYWAATLITSTGFGDYIATNQDEAIFVAFVELFSSVVLVYNINLIGSIVMNMRSSSQSTEKKRGIFKRMTYQYPITRNLEEKLISYIDFETEISERFEHKERRNLLNELPLQLKNEYDNDVNQTIFRSLPYFRHLRVEILGELASNFKSRVYYPGENLISRKSESDSIFILRRGEVSLKYQKNGASFMNGTTVQSIKIDPKDKNHPILLNSAFIDRSRVINFDLVAAEYSLIMNLQREEFMSIIRESSIQKEHYFTIYDKHENNLNFQGIKCETCREFHTKFECSKIHYVPLKTFIINKSLILSGNNQNRIKMYRESQRKEHCYYLRKDFFRAYEGHQNIVDRDIPAYIAKKLMKVRSIADYINEKEMLEAFESMFRKIMIEKKENVQKDDTHLDVDIAHNYLSYYIVHNSNLFNGKELNKLLKRKKLQRKMTLLNTNSKRNIYRMAYSMQQQPLNSFLIFN